MSTNTIHTPLETLLFFQSLRNVGVDSTSFGRVSEILKNNEFIQSDARYNVERLGSESLKTLYLQSLKDEIRIEREAKTSPLKEGENPIKRRKVSTPPLRTVDEATEHKHLIPRLVDRLYGRFRDQLVQAIKEEEKKYKELTKDVEEIEAGEWDARLQAEEESARRGSRGVSSIQGLLRSETDDNPEVKKGNRNVTEPVVSPDKAERQIPPPNGHASRPGLFGLSQASPIAASANQKSAEVATRTPQAVTSHGYVPLPPKAEAIQPRSRPSSQASNQPPILPPPIPSPSSINARMSYQNTPTSANASPRMAQTPISQAERGSGSPIILPPPPAMLGSSSSPTRTAFPPPQNPVPTLPPPHPLHQPRNYAQRPFPYYEPQQNFSSPFPAYGPQPISSYHQANRAQPSPYSTPTPTNYGRHLRQGGPQYQQPAHYGTFPSITPTQPLQGGAPLQPSFTPQVSRVTAQVTPATTVNERRRLQGLPPIDTSASATKWKSAPRNIPREQQRSPGPPPPHSPYLPSSPSPSPAPEPSKSDKRPTSPTQTRNADTPTRGRGRGRWGGRGRGRGGRGRAGSPNMVANDSRKRSESVATVTGDLSADTTTVRKLKAEPPTTPLAGTDDNNSFISTPAGDSSRPGARKKDALRTGETPKPSHKRKRASTLEGTPDVSMTQSLSRPGQILASRNFPRIVAPLLHDINSHKLASLFAKPLTERDAPGYSSLIYQPQDLKSIRAAISAGSRFIAGIPDTATSGGADDVIAVASPAAAGTPTASTTTTTTTKASNIWVERTADVVPPKAIVNSAQLEKELCRMYANAVMFNPDPKRSFGPAFRLSKTGGRAARTDKEDDADDEEEEEEGFDDEGGGFVRDAREMFEGVERSVAAWRAAERVNAGDVGMRGGGLVGVGGVAVEESEDVDMGTGTGGEDGEGELRRSRRG